MQHIISTSLEDSEQTACHEAQPDQFLDMAFITNPGGRDENQDCCGYTRAKDGMWVFCVADGLGGHNDGRLAAQSAVAGVLNQADSAGFRFENSDMILSIFNNAREEIISAQKNRSEPADMRSTLVVVAIKDGLAIWGHVGDVRLYHLRQNKIIFQTKDQSVPQMLVDMGEIEPGDIRGHPDRSRLLKALGKESEKLKVTLKSSPVQLEQGDIIHMSTDGFWEWIEEFRLQQILAEHPKPLDSLKALEEELRGNAAGQEPDYDNYTAMSISIGPVKKNMAFWHKTRFVNPERTRT